MCDATGLSQRRACRLTGLSLSTCRYEAQRPAADAHLSGRITELALERRRFGYRRIWQLLRREGLHVNHKRVYRLYHLRGLGVKRRRRRKGLATERLPLLRPAAPNLTWSMDFVMDALATGRRCSGQLKLASTLSFSSIVFPIRLAVTHHYIRAVLVRCNIQRYSPLLRELHR